MFSDFKNRLVRIENGDNFNKKYVDCDIHNVIMYFHNPQSRRTF